MANGLATKQRRFRPTLRATPEVLAVPTPKIRTPLTSAIRRSGISSVAWGTDIIHFLAQYDELYDPSRVLPSLFVTDHALLKVNIMTL